MKISWSDVSRIETPGDYRTSAGTLRIKQKDIDIWREHPEAVFEVITHGALASATVLFLGTYELPDGD